MEDQLNNTKKVITRRSDLITRSKRKVAVFAMAFFSLFLLNNTQAQSGAEIFKTNCASCHRTSGAKSVGPGLAGVGEKRTEEWLTSWISDSKAMIDAGDEDAIAIFKEFKNMPMAPYKDVLGEAKIKSIVDYLITLPAPTIAGGGAVASADGGSQATVVVSDTQKTIIFWGVIFIILIALYMYSLKNKVEQLSTARGVFEHPHAIKNYPAIFFSILIASAVIIYGLVWALQNNIGSIDAMMFAVLPYTAIGIFVVGSVYRYTKKGYKVSSLSTQFLEGKKLFWGSQPFHWGLLILFFGHLIAFLFPSTVLAWNGDSVRLLILEISSFAFALAALLGLILLIKRRLASRTLLVVTNKMDMVVYAILLVQIISGLGVAFFVRWGSSWFASVLTPYLRSVFSFDPELAAVGDAPVLVQLHIISAFAIIAIIPFTRFMHFLVAPIDYLFRKYQVVIWNWNRKVIRKSTRHNFGKKSRNH